MRILELGKYYPPHRGGMEAALADQCRALVESGHECRALVAGDEFGGRTEVLDGVAVQRLSTWGELRGLPITPGLLPALRGALGDFDPDLVHLHLPHPGAAWAWLWSGARDRPLLVSYHSDIVRQRWLGRVVEPWRQRVLSEADRIVVTSEALRDDSPSLDGHRDRCVVLPLGVALDDRGEPSSAESAELHTRFGGRFVLFVGRLVYYKGVEVLIQALEGTGIPLVVVGDGPMRRPWERLAAERGLSASVHFTGEVEPEALSALYHACAFFVLPSTAPSEAFGVVQLEAMACSKAVVACRASGGVASVPVSGETGLLVAPSDVPVLRAAIQGLWSDEEGCRRMGAAGRRRVEEIFDRSLLARRFVELAEEVAGHHPQRRRNTTP